MRKRAGSRPWWRNVWFSMRGLMILVLAIGSGTGGMILFVRQARAQHANVRAIEKAGGWVDYDSWTRGWRPRWSEWLVDNIGIDYFDHPVSVSIDDSRIPLPQVSEAVLVHIEHLHDLELLDLSGTRVPDSWLEHLQGLGKLRILGLNRTPVSDSGLERIRELGNLQTLFLFGTQVTDGGLVHLRDLAHLRGVDLRGTEVTESGVRGLQQVLPKALISH